MEATIANLGAAIAIVVSLVTAAVSAYSTIKAARKGVRDADVQDAMQANANFEFQLKMRDTMIDQMQDDNASLRSDIKELRDENRALRQELHTQH